MADTVTSSRDVQVVFTFADDDTRTISLPNPTDSGTIVEQLATLSAWCAENQPIVSDYSGATITAITAAYIVEQTKTNLDLT